MKKVLQIFRWIFTRLLPTEPIRITVSVFKTFILLFIVLTAIVLFYLRSQNKNELELLKVKHKEIQFMVRRYMEEMTYISPDSKKMKFIDKKVAEFKRSLNIIEDDMQQIQKIWFLE